MVATYLPALTPPSALMGTINMTALLATPDRGDIVRVTGSDVDGPLLGTALARDLMTRTGTDAASWSALGDNA